MPAHNDLITALEGHAALLDEFLALADEERRCLLSFDVHGLAECNTEREALLQRFQSTEDKTQNALLSLREERSIDSPEAQTITGVATFLSPKEARQVRSACAEVRDRAETLQTLSRANAVQAERGLRIVSGYLGLFNGSDSTGGMLYTPSGTSQRNTRTVATQAQFA